MNIYTPNLKTDCKVSSFALAKLSKATELIFDTY